MANGCREDVDTALLKLYAEQNHDSLLDLLASDNACVLADSVPWLEKYHKCVVLSVFLKGRRRMFGRRTLFPSCAVMLFHSLVVKLRSVLLG